MYGYLFDVFNNPEFSNKASYFIERITNNKSHTIFEYIKTRTNLLASTISISCTTIMGCIPVSLKNLFLNKFLNFSISLF
jgi:hypothetical protein